MSDRDLIDKVAELWDREGGDVKDFWMSVRSIAEAIDELQDRTKDVDYVDAMKDKQNG